MYTCSSDLGNPTILVSVDLSSALDMVDHSILLGRLYTSFGISGAAFSWLHSYLTNRSQCVRTGQSSSTYKLCSSATRSVLGSLLFTTYISPISNVASRNSNPGSLIRDWGICNPGILRSRLGYRLVEISTYADKNGSFHCTAMTLVHLANENNIIETEVQLNTSISAH